MAEAAHTGACKPRFHALPVRWTAQPGIKSFVCGESADELVAAHTKESDGKYEAWLPCTAGTAYNLTLHVYGNATSELNEVEERSRVQLLPHGLWKPGKRLAAPSQQQPPLLMHLSMALPPQHCSQHRSRLWGADSGSVLLAGGWRKLEEPVALPSYPRNTWASHNLIWASALSSGSEKSAADFKKLYKTYAPAFQNTPAAEGYKTHLWMHHEPVETGCCGCPAAAGGCCTAPRSCCGGWVDFLALRGRERSNWVHTVLGTGRGDSRRRGAARRRRPWVHVAGDSIASSLVSAMALFFGTHSTLTNSSEWKRSRNLGDYMGLKPMQFELDDFRLSFVFWEDKGHEGNLGRPESFHWQELGLANCAVRLANDLEPCYSAPDVLILNSGLWDVQDGVPEAASRELGKLATLIEKRLPATRVVWVGPLGRYLRPHESGRHEWRTNDRLARHVAVLRSELKGRRGVTFLDPRPMFAAVASATKVTYDGRHFAASFMLDLVNLIFNALLLELGPEISSSSPAT